MIKINDKSHIDGCAYAELKQAVKLRHSDRTFNGLPVAPDTLGSLRQAAADALKLWRTNGMRIEFVTDSDCPPPAATYGFIRGAATYMVLVSSSADRYDLMLGSAALETVVLYATRLGLASCWIGGTLRRSDFAAFVKLQDGEQIQAVVPVGTADRPRLRDKVLMAVARSRSRKSASQLFFDTQVGMPLSEKSEFYLPLEYVRLAPSSSNSQPWRVIVYEADRRLDLCSSTDNNYSDLDMGIALAHLAAGVAPRTLTVEPPAESYPRLKSVAVCHAV